LPGQVAFCGLICDVMIHLPTLAQCMQITDARGSPKMALVENRYKLLTDMEENSEPLLFDLLADPSESNNLAKQFPERVETMKKSLEQFRDSCKRSLAGKDYTEAFTPDDQDVHPSATRAPIKKKK
jgi:hypothetical protein